MKKIFALLIFLTASVLSYGYDFSDNNVYYTITSESTVEASGYYTSASYGPLTVPETVTYEGVQYTVTGIGNHAFKDKTKISDVILPETIIYIGEEAFARCSSMHTVNLPNSIESIGASAFAGCTNLTSPIVIPPLVTRIEDGAFLGCYKIPTIDIHDGVTFIGHMSLEYCKTLKEIYVPNSVTEISGEAFFECESLTYIHLPESLTIIPVGLLQACKSLKHVIIPITVTTISERAFQGMHALEEIVIPKNVVSIDDAFNYCDNLKRIIVLPSTPPTLENKLNFKYNIKFYFKESDIETYKSVPITAHCWADYKNKFDYKIPYPSTLNYSTYYREEFVSDFHVAMDNGTKPFVVTNFTESSAILKSLDDGIVPMGTGIVLRNGEPGKQLWYQIAEDQSSTYTGTNYLKGFCGEGELNPMEEDGSINYVLYDNTFCTFDNTGMLPIHKAYLQLPASLGSNKINMSFEDTSNGISEIREERQIDEFYNLNGIKVKTPHKGVYINNGKKVIIK